MARFVNGCSKRTALAAFIFLSICIFCFFFPAQELAASENDPALIRDVYRLLEENYVSEIDPELKKCKSVSEMLEKLNDPYTRYYDPEEYRQFIKSTEGAFGGVGMEVEQEKGDYVTVVRVFPGTPAERAGIEAGDLIIEVDGVSVVGSDLVDVVFKIRGEPGTPVVLTLKKPGQDRRTVVVTRDLIHLNIVESRMLADGVGCITLSTFSSDAAGKIKKAIEDLEQQGMRALVLDLRHNAGGYLHSALKIAELLVPEGKPLVHIIERGGREVTYESENDGQRWEGPLAVLIDNYSASASEIVTGAVRDAGSGIVVGSKSYGKGSVQTIFELPNGGAIKMTTAKYLTPERQIIDERGIMPDYEARDLLDTETDEGLETAVEILKEKFGLLPADLLLMPGQDAVFIDGEKWEMGAEVYIDEGRMWVPVRVLSKLGAHLQWDGLRKTVVVRKENLVLKFTAGNNYVTVNGVAQYIGKNVAIRDGRVFLPLRFLVEQMGSEVQWNTGGKGARIILQP